MDEDDDDLKPKGPPPPWIEQFRKDLREAMARAKRAEDADPNPEMFDPPEGRSLVDGQVHAVFMKRGPRPNSPRRPRRDSVHEPRGDG
jgi:hypothetical protein